MQSYNQPKLHPVNQEDPDIVISEEIPDIVISEKEPDILISEEKSDSSATKGKLTLKRAEMLLNISKKMAGFETLDGMLGTLVDIIVSALDADRATVFLHDKEADELYSLVARGNFHHEIRMSMDKGVAGYVFMKGKGAIVNDAYSDKRFDKSVDKKTGYKTESILCDPIKTVKGEIIGVAQVLNKRNGRFTQDDLELLDAVTSQAAVALKTTQIVEHMKSREREMKVLNKVIADITSEIDLGAILQKVMAQATKMLDSDRSTLFLNDEKTNELFSKVAAGTDEEIRLPNHLGIAGTVFTSGETVNIPYAYADLRFNPGFDKKTGYFTKSILCVPVVNKNGKTIGVIQQLNKRRGPFNEEDESRLKAFTAQISIALENAKLFDDVQNMKNFSESMLQSMSNGVITLNEDRRIKTCNAAGLKIMKVASEDEILEHRAEDFFSGANKWILDRVQNVEKTQENEVLMDKELEFGGEKVSANLNVLPLFSIEKKRAMIEDKEVVIEEKKKLGSMIMIEDISSEKRMKSTMSRYMDPDVADQLLAGGDEVLGGKSTEATVLFSDIRSFTTLTEELGAQGTVSLLNEYFTIMVECIQNEGGMLDKFIGDATMAAFGIPMPHDDDEDRGVRAAISMLTEMNNWNEQRIAQGIKPLDMGIGLNTGMIVTGNIGSPKRMDYTMIGDGVNLASRLESACKQYYARILISEFTFQKLKGTYRIREIDRVVVKGKTKPVGIYEVLDYYTEETFPNMGEVMGCFKDGRTRYLEREWDRAVQTFQTALGLNPNDKLSQVYIDRCNHYKEDPPPDDWDGTWVMKSK
ncbi:GAF domain-containing protein [Desulfonema magnum]|nr:GAF domain-containing protein [Desulfonema magnum]